MLNFVTVAKYLRKLTQVGLLVSEVWAQSWEQGELAQRRV